MKWDELKRGARVGMKLTFHAPWATYCGVITAIGEDGEGDFYIASAGGGYPGKRVEGFTLWDSVDKWDDFDYDLEEV